MHALTDDQQRQLDHFVTVFLAENAQINLSALRTEEACKTGNIEDSLALLQIADTYGWGDRTTLMDVGTGGGFPLLPLAIAFPAWRLTGLDSTGKKIAAVQRIADTVGIRNVTLRTDRAEMAGHEPSLRETFDIVTARAVAKIPELLEYCSPFVRVGGSIVLWKSVHIDEELAKSERAQAVLSCPLIAQHRYTLGKDFLAGHPSQSDDWGERQLLVFRKEAGLKKMYPRRGGLAKKEPLASL